MSDPDLRVLLVVLGAALPIALSPVRAVPGVAAERVVTVP